MNPAIKQLYDSFDNINNTKIIQGNSKFNLKIAVILDEFSYECFKYEATLIKIGIHDWKDTLNKHNPDFLFVESAWKGNGGAWQYKIAQYSKPPSKELVELIKYCKVKRIPTVFWNKEDPVYFSRFIEAAKLFDFVFTTDSNMINKYRKVLRHDNIYALPFAAQPKIHNPIDKYKDRLGNVAFAGTYHRTRFPNRKHDMKIVLEPALSYGLDIYDRLYQKSKSYSFQFPSIFQKNIKGHLPYDKMLNIYKMYDIFLNVNIVNDSPTMFSRRIFELLACGTNIISAYSLGIKMLFGEIVLLSESKEDTTCYLEDLLQNKVLRDKLSLLGQRKVFNSHTCKHRLHTILKKIGLECEVREDPGVSIICYVENLESINNIFESFHRQKYSKKELVLLISSSSSFLYLLQEKVKSHINIKVQIVPSLMSFGESLNLGVFQTSNDHISIFNSRQFYGEEFIGDLMNCFLYTDSGVVGKCSYFHYSSNDNSLALRFPDKDYQYVESLSDYAFIFKKSIFNLMRFRDTTEDVISIFFKDCVDNGIGLYSSDRFNYVCTDHITETTVNYNTEHIIIEKDHDYKGYISI